MRRRELCLLGGALPVASWSALKTAGGNRASRTKLFGMNIGRKNYDDPDYVRALARLDIAIFGFHPGWRGDRNGEKIASAAQRVQSLNPDLKLGQYTILNEAREERTPKQSQFSKTTELDRSGWWLTDAVGDKLQWTSQYKAWEINFTDGAAPNGLGQRYPQWLAKHDGDLYFSPGSPFGIWYVDNVMYRCRTPPAVWTAGGKAMRCDEATVEAAWRRGFVSFWSEIRARRPDLLIIGNSDNDLSYPEFNGQLDGAFLEGLMGKRWSLETRSGWSEMMRRYLIVTKNLRGPRIVGFNVWAGVDDYQRLRYALCSCLLANGHFSFTDQATGYSSVAWFDEYDIDLGEPVDPALAYDQVNTLRDDRGVYRRQYRNALVIVNPGSDQVTVELHGTWRLLQGKQDAIANSGAVVTRLNLAGKDGRILVRA